MKIIKVALWVLATLAVGLAVERFWRSGSADGAPAPPLEAPKTPMDTARSHAPSGHTDVLASDATPPRSTGARSFNSAKDMWRFAQDALQSNSEAQVHEGWWAARECWGFSNYWDEYANFASGGTSHRVTGELTPERQLAIQALGSRCGGFLSAGKRAGLELVRALARRETQLGGTIKAAETGLDSSSQRVAAVSLLLRSDSPSAVESGLMGLAEVWAAANKVAASDPRVASMERASMIVSCDLGMDCGADGYRTQLRCAMQGQCQASLWQDWSSDLTDEQAAEVTRARDLIRRAVLAGDLSLLGVQR